MAIVIPSSKTYDRQNPKVRDNVIERIEVGSVKVTPSNEYETPVYNSYEETTGITQEENFEYDGSSFVRGVYYWEAISYLHINPYYANNRKIQIKKTNKNKFISKIIDGKNQNNEFNIKSTVRYKRIYGQAKIKASISDSSNTVPDKDRISRIYDYEIVTRNEDSNTYSELPSLEQENKISVNLIDGENIVDTAVSVAKLKILDKTIFNNVIDNVENDSWDFSFNLLCGLEIAKLGKTQEQIKVEFISSQVPNYVDIQNPRILTGTYEKYIPVQIEITVYGNTIGIDLTDKTVYINGENQKKVHSIDGNELMQTTNYYQSTDTNAITRAFENTLTDYAKGKETATIRCSIGDYYDYDSGDKVISVDNSTEKMSFKLYDQVIPMVYGADGKDHAMSTYKDGSPKVFQVLGSKIYYDGAVWQELSLQEVDKSKLN